jgi:hypothetical protein
VLKPSSESGSRYCLKSGSTSARSLSDSVLRFGASGAAGVAGGSSAGRARRERRYEGDEGQGEVGPAHAGSPGAREARQGGPDAPISGGRRRGQAGRRMSDTGGSPGLRGLRASVVPDALLYTNTPGLAPFGSGLGRDAPSIGGRRGLRTARSPELGAGLRAPDAVEEGAEEHGVPGDRAGRVEGRRVVHRAPSSSPESHRRRAVFWRGDGRPRARSTSPRRRGPRRSPAASNAMRGRSEAGVERVLRHGALVGLERALRIPASRRTLPTRPHAAASVGSASARRRKRRDARSRPARRGHSRGAAFASCAPASRAPGVPTDRPAHGEHPLQQADALVHGRGIVGAWRSSTRARSAQASDRRGARP